MEDYYSTDLAGAAHYAAQNYDGPYPEDDFPSPQELAADAPDFGEVFERFYGSALVTADLPF